MDTELVAKNGSSKQFHNEASYQNLAQQQPYGQPPQGYSGPNKPQSFSDTSTVNSSQEYAPPQGDQPPPQQFDLRPQNAFGDYGEDRNKLQGTGKSNHCQALVATIILLAGVIGGVVLHAQGKIDPSGMFGLMGMCYFIYLVIACCGNDLRKYLGNISHGEHFESTTEKVRNMNGRFEFHAECYHYETRWKNETVRDANGRERTERKKVREKVVTHSATEHLTPARTIDESGRADRIRASANIVFIHFLIQYRFDSLMSCRNFEYHYQSFKARNYSDYHQDYTMRYEVPGLEPRKAFFVGELQCAYNLWYYVFGALGLMWPYSMWLESKIERFEINNMKVLTI